MTNRARDRRRGTHRSAGVIRHPSPRSLPAEDRQSVAHGTRGESFIRWRAVSGMIVLAFVAVLAVIFSTDIFYVRSVQVRGLQYLTKEEVFAFADVANYHLFWLDPNMIRENILRSPSIADADVSLGWPPDMVQIRVEERKPAIVWVENGAPMWVDLQGRMMTERTQVSDLIHINVNGGAFDDPLTDGRELDSDIVYGALQLQELLPEVTALNFDPIKGLGWTNNNGWLVWLGSGLGMDEKVKIYQTLSQNLIARGIQPGEVNIANPDAPFYTVLWGR